MRPAERRSIALGVGTGVWVLTVLVALAGIGRLTLTDALLLLAVTVIVPVGLCLHPYAPDRSVEVAVVVGAPVAVALSVPRGAVATALVVPWALLSVWLAVAVTRRWLARRRWLETVAWPAATGYLVVGAGSLVPDRADVEVLGYTQPLIELTAVHFHYAGFVASLVVGCLLAWTQLRDRLTAVAAVLVVVSPPIVAGGFLYLGLLQIVGGVLLLAGLWLVAWVTLRQVVSRVGRAAGVLLAASAIAVLVPMLLAVQWAVGYNYGTPALSIPAMVRTHGVLNAFGFALLGVMGWYRALGGRPPAGVGR